MRHLLQVAGQVLLVLAAVPAVLSPIVHARTPWRDSPMGRHLMVYMTVLGVVLGLSAIDVFVHPDPWWFVAVQLVSFVGVPIVMTWRLLLQLRGLRRPLLLRTYRHRKDENPR